MIPLDPDGYSVSSDGIIHTRYADHGNGIRTRTAAGVLNLLNGNTGTSCASCYPSPRYASPALPSKPQRRRSGRKR